MKYIRPEESLKIHGGTTTLQLAYCLGNRNMIVTNSPQFCQTLTSRFPPPDEPEVILAGGRFDFRSGLIRGSQCCSFIREYQCETAVASLFGCDAEGLTEADDEYAGLLRTIQLSCRRRIILMDSSEFRQHGIRRVLSWEKINMLITVFDPDNHEIIKQIRRQGMEVIVVPAAKR